jgi:hypothetical protein
VVSAKAQTAAVRTIVIVVMRGRPFRNRASRVR